MPENVKVLTVRLVVKDDGSISIQNAAKGYEQLGNAADRSGKKQRDAMQSVESSLGSAKTAVQAFLAAWVVKEVAGGLTSMVKTGIEFNAQMETSKLGLASLVSAFGVVSDASGKVLAGQDQWNASLSIGKELQDKLKIAALQTTAEYSDLLRALQEGIGPALKAGFNTDQVVTFTKTVAQSAAAIGLPMEQLGQEIRSLFSGDIGPDSRLANLLFSDIPRDHVKAYVAELQKSGKFFDEVQKRMGAFAKAGEEAGNTFSGAFSNLKDAITQALGEGTAGEFGNATQMLKDLTGEVVTFDAQGRATFNQDFVEGIQAITGAFASMAGTLVDIVKALPEIKVQFEAFFESMKQRGENAFSWARHASALGPVGMEAAGVGGFLFGGAESTQDIINRRTQEAQWAENHRKAALRAMGAGPGYDAPIGPAVPAFGLSGKPGAAAGDDAAKKQREQLEKFTDSYLDWQRDATEQAKAAGDPFEAELAKIEKDRRAMLEKFAKVPGAKAGINAFFDEESARAGLAAVQKYFAAQDKLMEESQKLTEQRNKETLDSFASVAGFTVDLQKKAEDRRIDAIQDSVERELQIRLKENNDWFAEQKKRLEEEAKNRGLSLEEAIKANGDIAKAYKFLTETKKEQDDEAEKHAELKRQESIAGTDAWANKIAQITKDALGTVADDVANAVIDSQQAMTGAFDGFFSDLIDGQVNVGDMLKNLGKDLGNAWAKVFSNMLTRAAFTGESITSQFKAIWDGLKGTTGLDAAASGAGIGAMIGGVGEAIAGPNTYASEGGMIGGALGAAIIGYLTAGAGTGWGAVIGSAIGTGIGSMIQKGEDWIAVSIQNGVATVTEKGITAQARERVQRDIQTQVREVTKEWRSILDIFPDEVRAKIRGLNAHVNIDQFKTEAGDIRDENAMSALSEFLGEQLPQAAFDAYSGAIKQGLELLGVDKARITQEFEYFGSLQGKDLQDAVRKYIETLVEAINVADLFNAPFADRLQASRDASAATPLTRMTSVDQQIADIVGTLNTLDVEDQLKAQEQINQLARSRYDMEIQYLQQIDAIQKSIHDSISGLKEQIDLAGKDDQGKIDYYWQRMNEIRVQLQNATDPAEVARLAQQFQGYASQAFNAAPDNEENRRKLQAYLDEIQKTSDEKLQAARDKVMEEDLKAAAALQDAAEALQTAAALLNPDGTQKDRGRAVHPVQSPGGGTGTGTADPNRQPGQEQTLPEDPLVISMQSMEAISKTGSAATLALLAKLEAMSSEPLEVNLRIDGNVEAFMRANGMSLVAEATSRTLRILRNNPDAARRYSD